jgi:hypothetical protein
MLVTRGWFGSKVAWLHRSPDSRSQQSSTTCVEDVDVQVGEPRRLARCDAQLPGVHQPFDNAAHLLRQHLPDA